MLVKPSKPGFFWFCGYKRYICSASISSTIADDSAERSNSDDGGIVTEIYFMKPEAVIKPPFLQYVVPTAGVYLLWNKQDYFLPATA